MSESSAGEQATDFLPVAVFGVVAYAFLKAFTGFSETLSEISEAPTKVVQAGGQAGSDVITAGGRTVESALSIPETVFSGTASGLQSGGSAIASTPSAFGDGLREFSTGITDTTNGVRDRLSGLSPF